MTTPRYPTRLYLQVEDQAGNLWDGSMTSPQCEEITWHTSRINASDLCYVRYGTPWPKGKKKGTPVTRSHD